MIYTKPRSAFASGDARWNIYGSEAQKVTGARDAASTSSQNNSSRAAGGALWMSRNKIWMQKQHNLMIQAAAWWKWHFWRTSSGVLVKSLTLAPWLSALLVYSRAWAAVFAQRRAHPLTLVYANFLHRILTAIIVTWDKTQTEAVVYSRRPIFHHCVNIAGGAFLRLKLTREFYSP